MPAGFHGLVRHAFSFPHRLRSRSRASRGGPEKTTGRNYVWDVVNRLSEAISIAGKGNLEGGHDFEGDDHMLTDFTSFFQSHGSFRDI
jgi:hypothetical protein